MATRRSALTVLLISGTDMASTSLPGGQQGGVSQVASVLYYLRACYAMSGTETCIWYAQEMPGTDMCTWHGQVEDNTSTLWSTCEA